MSDVIRETAARCSNWGKWGPDDERGTLNYITPDFVHVMIGGRIVKSGGKELAHELEEKGYEGVRKELGLGEPDAAA